MLCFERILLLNGSSARNDNSVDEIEKLMNNGIMIKIANVTFLKIAICEE